MCNKETVARFQVTCDYFNLSCVNNNGTKLEEFVRTNNLNILNNEQPTFLCVGGSSKIDLVIATNNLKKKWRGTTVDDEIELFTGAPNRGHVPVITSFNFKQQKNVREEPNWTKTDWNPFNEQLEK